MSAVPVVLVALLLVTAPARTSLAQTVRVDVDSPKQSIRGFGGINHPAWIGDLTADQRDTAFGNGPGQIGMTVLRMFVDENSNNWSKELPTARRALELGATVFASPWNPPAAMTEIVNGKKRLRYDRYAEYASHLDDFVHFMESNDVDLYAISVQNEPDYADEWTWWTPDEMLRFMKENAGTIATRVIAPESFQYRKAMSDPILEDPVALANLDILGAHLYGTQLKDFPYPLFKAKGAGKELWMTEVYTDSQNDADAWPMALDVAYSIHNSMVEAEFNAYVWWYIRRSYGPIKENGQVSKRGYCMAQYSKFVRPGFVRVEATKNPAPDVYVSAYESRTDVVIVVVNRSTASKSITFAVSGADVPSYERFITSSSKNLGNGDAVVASSGSFSVDVDGQSVTTLRGTRADADAGAATGAGGARDAGAVTSSGGFTGSGGLPNVGGFGPGTGGQGVSPGGAVGATGGSGGRSGSAGGADGSAPGGVPSTGGSARPDASGGGSSSDDSGCGCRTARTARVESSAVAAALVALLALLVRRRRHAMASHRSTARRLLVNGAVVLATVPACGDDSSNRAVVAGSGGYAFGAGGSPPNTGAMSGSGGPIAGGGARSAGGATAGGGASSIGVGGAMASAGAGGASGNGGTPAMNGSGGGGGATPPTCPSTFQNPSLWQDLADLEVIRVGDVYYYTASTMHYSPGAPILRSRDLVNWEYVGHSVPVLDYDKRYDLNGGRSYVNGIWASSLRYRESNKTFYWIGCMHNVGGGYVYTATAPEGPWTKHKSQGCYYDVGLLIDDDDKMYTASGNTVISVAELSADGFSEVRSQQVFTTPSSLSGPLEGSRFYEIDGKYYILATQYANGEYVLRSTSGPFGPYELRPFAVQVPASVPGAGHPHQGGIVQTQTGDWYYMGFIDAYPGGRVPVLAPVTWSADGWPSVVLDNGKWGASYPFPHLPCGAGVKPLTGTDTFAGAALGAEWEWNHNPDDSRWSAGGQLTLRTATVTSDLYAARNTLTHRILGPTSTATIELDYGSMHDGDVAGLALLRDSSAWIGVKRTNGAYRVAMVGNLKMDASWNTTSTGTEMAGASVTGGKIWLRAAADIHPGANQQGRFSYSTDGTQFTQLGTGFTLNDAWQFFMGYRFAIFDYATQSLGGSVSVTSFTLEAP